MPTLPAYLMETKEDNDDIALLKKAPEPEFEIPKPKDKLSFKT